MILHRYILRGLVGSFLFAFVVVMAVCLIGTSFQVFRSYQGLGFEILPRMAPFAAGYVAPWALLVAACTSTTLVYGRLSAENEINAMRMSGIHANRIIAPACLFGLALAAAAFAIHEHAAPAAADGRRRLIKDSTHLLLKLPPPGAQQFKIGPYMLSYRTFRDGRMEEIDLMKWGPDDRLEVEYHAASGQPVFVEGEPPRIVMAMPSSVAYHRPDGSVQRATLGSDFSIPLEIEGVTKKEKKPDLLSRDELEALIVTTVDPRRRSEILTVLHTRRAQTFAPLLLVLVCVPIGILVRRGSRLAGLGAALPPLVVYLVVFFVFQGMGDKGRVAPALAAWLPNGFLAAQALVLLAGVYRK